MKRDFEINEPRYSLKKIGFTDKPLSKKEMVGNHFQIKIDGASDTASQFEEYDRILNFYGYQRFGSTRPISHLIGKSLLQKNYLNTIQIRSEERRVGKECRSRWSPYH